MSAPRLHPSVDLLSVEVEDYYHIGAFQRIIPPAHWGRFERRLEQSTMRALDLLERFQITGTFFVRGWIADKLPDILQEISKRGHEIASEGYYHGTVGDMTVTEFRQDLERAADALEQATGKRTVGYRFPRQWLTPVPPWALQVLADEGYAYHSSFVPLFGPGDRQSHSRFAHQRRVGDTALWEFPLSTCSLLGWRIPIAGGNYFRQFPHAALKYLVERWHRTHAAPFVMYFHLRELDPEQPRISAASPIARIRHYRNLDKMAWVLEDYFRAYRFTGMAEYVQFATGRALAESPRGPQPTRRRPSTSGGAPAASSPARSFPAPSRKTAVSIVVPCFNEEATVPYLANTLAEMMAALQENYDLHLVFVDDASVDGTWNALHKAFDSRSDITIVRHPKNLGIAGAILTGIRESKTEVVCSIDCDCSYDPLELRHMIPMLRDGVDLVTASPYHPGGKVFNVPGWRLRLSKMASFLYRRVTCQKLFTYTSCFRVYRRSALLDLPAQEPGFVGVAEMIGRLDLQGRKIAEYPAALHIRVLGRSKMRLLRPTLGHLRLMVRLAALRMAGPRWSAPISQDVLPGSRHREERP